MPSGHLATAYLMARRRPASRLARFAPLALGVMLPDLVDKGAMHLGLTPYGRTVGHAAVVWAAAALLVVLIARARGRIPEGPSLLVLGGASHLLADLLDDAVEGLTFGGPVFAGWAGWPWTNPDMLAVRTPWIFARPEDVVTSLELVTVLTAVVLSVRDTRASR